jgi:hypothetical protein
MSYTVEQFKAQFPRFTPQFLSDIVYKNNTTYFKNNVVYYDGSFYICIVENTTNDPLTTSDWKIYQDSVLNYTQDEDIQEAIQEASINFNESLFGDCNKAKTAFGLLVAFYVTYDFSIALGTAGVGIATSKSVGSVSESYGISTALLENPKFAIYAQNGYGCKYLSLIMPYLVGNIILVNGSTTIA